MTSDLAYEVKGIISFPCCIKEKIVVYEGTCGLSSNKCPRCGKYAVFDYENMTSTRTETVRGVSHRFTKR